jgi:protease IV
MLRWLKIALGVLLLPFVAALEAVRRWRFGSRAVVHLDAGRFSGQAPSPARALARALESLRSDPATRAVWITLSGTSAPIAHLQELHLAIRRLREAHKPVFVDLASAGNADLLVSSAATRVFLVPSGEIHAGGLVAHTSYLGDALHRLGVEVEVLTAGAFKSAGEPLSRGFPSARSRTAQSELLGDLEVQFVNAIAQGRDQEPQLVQEALERVPLSAEEALRCKLVDRLAWPDEVEGSIEEELGGEARVISWGAWRRWRALERGRRGLSLVGKGVAVVQLRGLIVQKAPSRSGPELIDASEVVPVLEALGRSDDIAAVVLDIDSSGGSALASDLLWRAVQRLQERKPVVAAFGGVAASGGYFLAAGASEVFAMPGTITGSIGVIMGRPVWGRALDRLGVHTEVLRGAASADLDLPERALRPDERARLQDAIERSYRIFLSRVASGRRMPVRAVEPNAGGRVWSGQMAVDRGLVDHFGTASDAWARACRMAGLPADPSRTPRWEVGFARRNLLRRLVRGAIAEEGTQPVMGLLRLLQGSGLPSAVLYLLLHGGLRSGEALAVLPWDLRVE